MRNPKRIAIMLKKLKTIWENNPDLRLMQLLGNCFGPGDSYYKEDKELLKKLMATYEKKEKNKGK